MDLGEHIFLRVILHLWYVPSPESGLILIAISTGTFWLVQGTSLMPFFAVGTMYSPTGNTLEGMQTPEYSATIGKPLEFTVSYRDG